MGVRLQTSEERGSRASLERGFKSDLKSLVQWDAPRLWLLVGACPLSRGGDGSWAKRWMAAGSLRELLLGARFPPWLESKHCCPWFFHGADCFRCWWSLIAPLVHYIWRVNPFCLPQHSDFMSPRRPLPSPLPHRQSTSNAMLVHSPLKLRQRFRLLVPCLSFSLT